VAAEPPAPTGPVVLTAPELWPGAVELRPLAVAGDGTLEVPATADEAGWWAAGPRPGEVGAAVVVGHVDLDGRPGVFARLGEASPGAVVVVGSGAGAVRYRVASVASYRKADFPTDLVYGPTDEAELRLITCGGRFDKSTGHYEDNVVVRAVRI
jgi:sortase (surface protein transpeptidase)